MQGRYKLYHAISSYSVHSCLLFKCLFVVYLHTGGDKNAAAYCGWQPYGTVCFVVQGSRLCIGYFPETVHIRRLIFMMTSLYWNVSLIAFREWNPPAPYKWLVPIMHIFVLSLNKLLSKQSPCQRFKIPWRSCDHFARIEFRNLLLRFTHMPSMA